MSKEEDELRYIRCPACRSLIPADAVRCRRCGAAVPGSSDTDSQKVDPEAQILSGSKSLTAASAWLAYYYAAGPHELN